MIDINSMQNKPAILVVDDEAVNRGIAVAMLTAAGWRVDEVADGPAAIRAVRDGHYALVLMDIQMADMDGFEATTEIRRSESASAAVPIVAFTAMQQEEVAARLQAVGMDGLIIKPFTASTLIAAVEPWRPDGVSPPVRRLASIFGEAEVASLIERFREQLSEALAPADAARHRGRAHQIAGIAGTLGFSEVSRTWLAVAEGDDSCWPAARIAARKALAQSLPKPELPLKV